MLPSGAARATVAADVVPPAPGCGSTTIGWPELRREMLGDEARGQVDVGAGREPVHHGDGALGPRRLGERRRDGQAESPAKRGAAGDLRRHGCRFRFVFSFGAVATR